MFETNNQVFNQSILIEPFVQSNCLIDIKREDLLHKDISGNKYRKMKYNIIDALKKEKSTLLTFGGAYSNHIAAAAAAGKEFGIKTIGVIRGEEIIDMIDTNPTLSFAKKCGMTFHFISRKEYREKTNKSFIEKLKELFGDFYLLPEGGTNDLAVKGCEEILDINDKKYDYVCAAVGTGGTLAGIVRSSYSHQNIIGFSALKGTFQSSVIKEYTRKRNFKIIDDYCFGGYAKIDLELIRFINTFNERTGIPLDPIYTGKMLYGIFDLINKGEIMENSSILAIHTGGLQGVEGMNQKLKNKNLPQITI